MDVFHQVNSFLVRVILCTVLWGRVKAGQDSCWHLHVGAARRHGVLRLAVVRLGLDYRGVGEVHLCAGGEGAVKYY